MYRVTLKTADCIVTETLYCCRQTRMEPYNLIPVIRMMPGTDASDEEKEHVYFR